MKSLLADIRACRICYDNPQFEPGLPHAPRPVLRISRTARVCISGQAPGTRVHASGIPFDDPSGDRLRDWMGVDRDTFYDETRLAIIPMGFCFPGLDAKGGDLPPRKECGATWHDRVYAALPQLELILTIGQYAHAYHLKDKRAKTLTDTVKNWRSIYEPRASRRYLPLPHPSWRNSGWLKKNPWFAEELLPVLRGEVKKLVG